MSKSAPFDLVMLIYRPVWEADSRYKGEKYRATGRDLKSAKEFLSLNPDILDEVAEFQEHALEYLKSKFDGWSDLKHPFWGLANNYNTYTPKKTKEQREHQPKPQLPQYCDICEHHGRQTLLKPKEFCPICFPICEKCNIQHALEQSCEDAKKNMERLQRILYGDSKRVKDIKQLNELL